MNKTIIAIDPDVDKSGVCYFETESRVIEGSALAFPELMEYFSFTAKTKEYGLPLIIVEAGYLNKSNWHIKKSSIAKAAAIGNHTGRNHEVARKIVEMARHYGFNVMEVKPLKKRWKGTDKKITQAELDNLMMKSGLGKLGGRMNQEVRDATLLAIHYSGIQMRM